MPVCQVGMHSNHRGTFAGVGEDLRARNEVHTVHRITSYSRLERCTERLAAIRVTEIHVQVRHILNHNRIIAVGELANGA